jgi:hypothetical protein
MARISWVLLVVCAVWAGPAKADKFDTTLDIGFYTLAGATNGEGFVVKGSGEEAAAADAFVSNYGVHTAGDGSVWGLALKLGLSVDGWRFGGALGGLGMTGMSLRHKPFPGRAKLHASGDGMLAELYTGYAFGDVRSVRFYGDLCLRLIAGFVDATVTSAPGTSETFKLSLMDKSQVAVRVGALVWVNEYIFLDLAAEYSVVGSDLAAFTLGVGLPIPLDNL